MRDHAFWDWFLANERALWNVQSRSDEVLEPLQNALSGYQYGLSCEVSEEESGKRELIISAGGDRRLFDAVEALVAQAPRLDRWNMFALKPPRGFDFTLENDATRVNPRELVFEPLASRVDPRALGIRVFVDAKTVSPHLREAVSNAVEIGLGEKVAGDIQRIEVVPLDKPVEEYIPLKDLAAYLEWFKKKTAIQ